MKKFSKVIICLVLVLSIAVLGAFALTACNKDKRAKVGYQNGTTAEYYVNGDEDWGFEGFSNIKGVGYTSAALAVTDMINGNIKYVVVDELPAKNIASKNNKVKVIDIKLTDEDYAFAVDKTNSTLLTELNTWLAANQNTISEISAKYFNGGETVKYPAGTKDTSKKQLVVATNAEFAPFEYMEGDKFTGIDIEIMGTFAAANGYELVIENMDFDSVVTSVGSNGINIAAAALTVNSERAQVVNFSTTYYKAAQMVICLKDDNAFANCTTADDVVAVLKSL